MSVWGGSLRLLIEIGGETDASAFGRRRVHQLTDCREDGGDGLVMVLELVLQLFELLLYLHPMRGPSEVDAFIAHWRDTGGSELGMMR